MSVTSRRCRIVERVLDIGGDRYTLIRVRPGVDAKGEWQHASLTLNRTSEDGTVTVLERTVWESSLAEADRLAGWEMQAYQQTPFYNLIGGDPLFSVFVWHGCDGCGELVLNEVPPESERDATIRIARCERCDPQAWADKRIAEWLLEEQAFGH